MDLKQTVLYLSAGLLLGCACLAVQGPLPGDVSVARALQSMLGSGPSWAKFVTHSAKAPGLVFVSGVDLFIVHKT